MDISLLMICLIVLTLAGIMIWTADIVYCYRILKKIKLHDSQILVLAQNAATVLNPFCAFAKLDPAAKLPKYQHKTDSGMDVHSVEAVLVLPHSFAKVRTGIAALICPSFELQIRPRSGLAAKNGIVCAYGTVDNGYRGEIGVTLYNHGDEPFMVEPGMRIAQFVMSQVSSATVVEITPEKLHAISTERGKNGFGSTGLKESANGGKRYLNPET